MAFVTIEDLYGATEIIVFENCYNRASNILLVDNIVLVDGRLSIKEDDEVKIVANTIVDFENATKNVQEETIQKQEQKPRKLTLNIQNTTEQQKAQLRGAIRFFSGERNNIIVQIKDDEE